MSLAFLRAFALALLGLPVTLLGLPIVLIGVQFARTDESTRRPFTSHPELGTWALTLMPDHWAFKPWQNFFDGLLGDVRGDWAWYCLNHYGRPCTNWLCMWLWAAIRNPANTWSRVTTGVDVSRCVIHHVAGDAQIVEEPGQSCIQVTCAVRDDGVLFPRFFMSIAHRDDPTLATMIDIGWKVKTSHNGTAPDADPARRLKGSVFTVSSRKKLV